MQDVLRDGGRSMALESWLNRQGLLKGEVLCTDVNGTKHFCYAGTDLNPTCSFCGVVFADVFGLVEHLVVTRSDVFASGSTMAMSCVAAFMGVSCRPSVVHMCTQTCSPAMVDVGTVQDQSVVSVVSTVPTVNDSISIQSTDASNGPFVRGIELSCVVPDVFSMASAGTSTTRVVGPTMPFANDVVADDALFDDELEGYSPIPPGGTLRTGE